MKIIKESKQEKLPIEFITQFVSKGWEEVGNLKASIEGIKHEFKDTKKVEDILQDLVDAYLIAIGQMELHLDKKDYVELPDKEELNEALTESNEAEAQPIEITKQQYDLFNSSKFNGKSTFSDKLINKDNKYFWNGSQQSLNAAIEYFKPLKESSPDLAQPIEAKKFEDENKTEIFTELPDYDVEVEQKGEKIEIELEPKDDEWPEPAEGDDDIEDAKRAIASGEISLGSEVVNNRFEDEIRAEMPVPEVVKDENKIEKQIVLADDFMDMDFPEVEVEKKERN